MEEGPFTGICLWHNRPTEDHLYTLVVILSRLAQKGRGGVVVRNRHQHVSA